MASSNRQLAQIMVATDIGQKLRSALEFGAVVAIVTILVTLALRNYETYLVRAQLTEAFNLTSLVRAEIVVYRAQHGGWPASAADVHSPTLEVQAELGQYVDYLVLDDGGSLSTVFGRPASASLLNGQKLTMRPMTVPEDPGSPVFWACSAYRAPHGFVPGGPDNTDIDIAHLPAICRDY